ncbi:MAG: serine/threonine protein kinase [Candidatus Nealsonbacteria bacterium]|nr:serine/threonine protein kinase [Candidatus Nealsonbacteria bacterium]
MEPGARYEMVSTIAAGDFATVYRARDRELGREVAIKQIHPQFLADPQQLARYWQEAQLLASLQHPNILTIYDIVRPRGWLILELMRGNLHPYTEGQPIDLDFLRSALVGSLHALHFLHTNGVIHGDVKPSNLLVDARGRVVLGDFGLARRASSEQGSLLKGTTKYMAPELVANQFGAVGPASDLYSLGFSAFELMCGPQFESLFPGLASFGRDKQIAWMMWHAAADRGLPEIGRVLQGVPDDLARVIQRMVVKDQAGRYTSARDALQDLNSDALSTGLPDEEDAEAMAAREAEDKKRRRLRLGAIVALCFSAVICIAMFLPRTPPPAPPKPPEPISGVVRGVYGSELEVTLDRDGSVEPIPIRSGDKVFINGDGARLRDLEPGDRVTVEYVQEKSGGQVTRVTRVLVARPVLHIGTIKSIRPDRGTLVVAVGEGDDKGKEISVTVRKDAKIKFNEQPTLGGKAVALADLQPDDRIEIRHVAEDTGNKATDLSVLRVVETSGIIRSVNLRRRQVTVALGEDDAKLVAFSLAPDCKITLNDRAIMDSRALTPADLSEGDEVTLAHDVRVVRIDAYHTEGEEGTVLLVAYDRNQIDAELTETGQRVTYTVGPDCEIRMAGVSADLTELRKGDKIDALHDSPGQQTRHALSIAARRPPDPARWAILIANQRYDDASLSPLGHPAADIALLADVLTKRYAVPAAQVQTFVDASRVRLSQAIPEWLGKVAPGQKVIVYYTGHAYLNDAGAVYLAPKNFDLKQINTTGLSLQWLVDQCEQCVAGEKLLLLDCSHPGEGTDLQRQPSTAEMIRTLAAAPGRSPLRTVTAVVSCRAGQRGLVLADKTHGLFGSSLAEAYSGKADKNRDGRLEPTELFTFLTAATTAAAGQLSGEQTPELFLPDDRPPRLSEEAKKGIRRLAAYLRQDKIDVGTVMMQYPAVEQLAGEELEPKLIYGLLMLKARERDEAARIFEEIKIEKAGRLLPLQGLVWVHFGKRSYPSGMRALAELLEATPKPRKPGDPVSPEAQAVLQWAGRLREYATAAAGDARIKTPSQAVDAVDAAATAHGQQAVQLYQQAREQVTKTAAEFDAKIAAAAGDADTARLKVERRQLSRYASFPYDDLVRDVVDGLDK